MFGNMSGMSAMGFTYIFRQMGSFLMVHGFGNVSAASLVLGECGLQRKSHRKSGLQDRQVCWIVRSAGRKRRIVGKSGKSPQPPQVRSVRSVRSSGLVFLLLFRFKRSFSEDKPMTLLSSLSAITKTQIRKIERREGRIGQRCYIEHFRIG